jgi:hypothetical protein
MIAMLFVSDNTMLVMGPHSSRDAIKAQAGGGSTLKSSPKFVEMYSKITTTDTMWGLMNGDSKIFKRLPIAKPKAVYGSVNITDGVASDIYMRLGTPDDATQLAQLIKSQAAPAISMVDTFEVTSDGPEVHVKGSASLQKITNLTSLLGLGTHRGPMGGGAGGP